MSIRWKFVIATVAVSLILASANSWVVSRTPNSTAADILERSPARLDQLFQQRDALEQQFLTTLTDAQLSKLKRDLALLDEKIDAVGGQRYCSQSRLFWFTDLEQAKAAAKQSGKPILTLRMLGKLTDELSCANSRFFRTTLYANQEVAKRLRENFVLHWESVRPVPVLTVDFGDGRKLVRTVTGNSIHYVLTPDGDVVDALPGLFGPAMFLRLLEQAQQASRVIANASAPDRAAMIAAYHQQSATALTDAWANDLQRLQEAGGDAAEAARRLQEQLAAQQQTQRKPEPAPAAEKAVRVAVPKMMIERKLINNLTGRPTAFQRADDLEQRTTEALWTQLAILHAQDATLDYRSESLVESEHPTAAKAATVAYTKGRVESPLIRQLRSSIAQDSIRNQYLLHRKIHEWFVAGAAPSDLRQLNEKVYAELFLTPSSDPWLGLVPDNTYTGLKDNGIVTAK